LFFNRARQSRNRRNRRKNEQGQHFNISHFKRPIEQNLINAAEMGHLNDRPERHFFGQVVEQNRKNAQKSLKTPTDGR
jgi:hypothetical protein